MKIILLHQYFKTPEEGGGIRSWHLCRALIQAGHEVEVVTAWNKKSQGTMEIDGYTVHYLPVHYDNELGFVKRISSFLRFFQAAYKKIRSLPQPDYIYAISTPLTVGILAMLIKRKQGTPFFFEVGDLWPDVPVQMGYIKNRLLIRILKTIELSIYKAAKGIVAMSPAMVTYFDALGHGNKTICITNFADLSLMENPNPGAEKDGKFTILYAGTLGKANQLGYLIDLATEATERKLEHFKCIIMGDGAEKELLQKIVMKRNLSNVSFLAHESKHAATQLMKNASMMYLSFGPYDKLWTGSPNKYFDALAVGKPVICNFEGWIATEIRSKNCGVVYKPTNPKSFFEKNWPLLETPEALHKMGENARTLAEEKYSLEKQIPLWLAFLAH